MQEFVIFKRCSKHCNTAENVASMIHFQCTLGEFEVSATHGTTKKKVQNNMNG